MDVNIMTLDSNYHHHYHLTSNQDNGQQ